MEMPKKNMKKSLILGLAISTLGLSYTGAANANTLVGGFDATGLTANFNPTSIVFQDGQISRPNGIFLPFAGDMLTVSPLTFISQGFPVEATSTNPIVQNGFSFIANSPIRDTQAIKTDILAGASFDGTFLMPNDVTYRGTLAITAQSIGDQESYSLSAEAFTIDRIEPEAIPEPLTILGTGFALAALPSFKKAQGKKKV
jgi:hypothetical protein